MKVTLNWLKQYVDFNWPPDELAQRLTMLGIEVEGTRKLGGEFDGITVAQVLSSDKHPNADKLSVCRVNDGKEERQIVCGAKNYQVGDKVALILPGNSLPAKPGETPITIKAGKIRGVESQGMMCSPKELGLAEEADGILILPADAKVGQPFAEHLGRPAGDVLYDLEITPNRPDLNSVIGLAREISAVTGNPLRIPEIPGGTTSTSSHSSSGKKVTDAVERVPLVVELVAVRIDDPDLCPRYVARVVQGVKIGPSPDWLRHTLEKVGIRSINNVVDVTNYVMMETGQPLHAFDYHLISKQCAAGVLLTEGGQDARPTIVIRRAGEGEKFITLDGQERTLTNEMLLIADETKAIALAGVMGGQNSEINERTVDVLIESAYFKPSNIRATSKKLDLRTDASYRFERGADIGITEWASRRCAQLVLETAGGQLAEGVADAYPEQAKPREIPLRYAKTTQLLGINVPIEQQNQILQSLELKLKGTDHPPAHASPGEKIRDDVERVPTEATFQIPTFRVDLKREVDLIEEVVRLYGVDKVPATTPRGAVGGNEYDAVHDQIAEARRILTGLGLNEAQTQTLIDRAAAELTIVDDIVDISVKQPLSLSRLVRLSNPLSTDMNVLRPSLLIGLLDSIKHNVSHRINDVALFEIGRVFEWANNEIDDPRLLSIAITGLRPSQFWLGHERGANVDIYDLKGVLEGFFEEFGLRGVVFKKDEKSLSLFLESAAISLGGRKALGKMGQLRTDVGTVFGIRQPVFIAELKFDVLLAHRSAAKSFKPLPQFPTIRRDVAMFVPEATTHEAVLNVVKQAKPLNLESVELFDVFRGSNVSPGQKSMAYAFTYRHAERTLTDTEVNAAHEKLVEQFKQRLGAVVRAA